jgi:putative GTP pyrophosphokinase
MMFTIFPLYSKNRVTKAGSAVRASVEGEDDKKIIENWRASHNYVLNTFQATLRRYAKGGNITVAQRLKRRNTIYDKLKRHPGMQLARMHDIAGCRLIFEDMATLNATRLRVLGSKFKHKRRNSNDDYDYTISPKENGYRGIHDFYEYSSYSGSAKNWNGLLIELQYRTKYQHAWATAFEIVGSLTGQEAKFDRGDKDHQDFFTFIAELIARHYDKLPSSMLDVTDE